ncbi:putative glycine dehydrogenase (decarboxylating) subunit 1 [Abditibacteriota bacterium]|nr:putative glycine dehydrogenase (decarboxylating) subunit 1 [Abditibacteriota bacterium]
MPYFSLTPADREAMLATIGVQSADELFADIPASLREAARAAFADLESGRSEMGLKRDMARLAAKNTHAETATCFLGAGLYDHYVPAAVSALASRGEFVTAYTPYQAETSQGTLQVIYEFQSLLCRLTGMEMANASLYDGATGLAEALILAHAATKKKRVLLPRGLSPSYRRVSATYLQGLPIEIEEIPFDAASGQIDSEALSALLQSGDVAAVVVAQPNFFGVLEDAPTIAAATHAAGALLIAVFNPLSLGILPPPGSYDADVAIADGQSLGLPLTFGGPGLGLFCCKQKFSRLAPGRLVGLTTDANGKRGFTLTLQTREQHIRREKATSNICSNQALCALVATIYLATMGERGIREAASHSFHKAAYAREQLQTLPGVKPLFSGPQFHEFALRLPVAVETVGQALASENIIGPYDLGRDYPELEGAALFCCTEKRSREEIDFLAETLRSILPKPKVESGASGSDLNGSGRLHLEGLSIHYLDDARTFYLDW